MVDFLLMELLDNFQQILIDIAAVQ